MPVAKPKINEATGAPPRRDAGRGADACNPDRAMTLAEAAGMLDVTQDFMTHLMDNDFIPPHMVGTHRRVMLRDVLAFKKIWDRRSKALDEIIKIDQELGFY